MGWRPCFFFGYPGPRRRVYGVSSVSPSFFLLSRPDPLSHLVSWSVQDLCDGSGEDQQWYGLFGGPPLTPERRSGAS